MKAFILAAILLLAAPALAVDRMASWTDLSNNETGFRVQKCPGNCSGTGTFTWTEITVTPINATSFLITGVAPGSTTSYRVGATNTAGTGWSSIVVDVVPLVPVPPTAPGVFTLPPCKVLTETAPGSGLYQCS